MQSNRREFLLLSRRLVLSSVALGLAPLRLCAEDLENLGLARLSETDAIVLAQVSRLLFPHDALADEVYLEVVQDMDRDMEKDKKVSMLLQGVRFTLDRLAGKPFTEAGNREQVQILKGLQGTDLFNYLHSRSIDSLYGNPAVWKLLGYQGSSVEYGGYLHRGFDDIDWLE